MDKDAGLQCDNSVLILWLSNLEDVTSVSFGHLQNRCNETGFF